MLVADGSNWPTYQEHITNVITSKKLQRHLTGTACKLATLVEHDESFYWDNKSLALLSDKEIDDLEEAMEGWLQKEAQVHKIIYSTVDQLTFCQVKGEPTAAAIWKKLTSIHGNKEAMYKTDLLAQLQNTCFVKNSKINICTHLTNMVVVKEHLTKIRCPLSDASFVSYICTSLLLAPMYKPLFTTLAMSVHTSGRLILSQDLIWHLNEEENSAAIKTNINCQHKAMVAAHTKTCGDKSGKDKSKSKSKDKDKQHCDNCNKNGHTKD
ncbi:hypothetical protein C0989_003995 [Termitomyces sp. Mn162]|nr:hypothetical protein C0989_003995 [Termitomyces sp. Mn162]